MEKHYYITVTLSVCKDSLFVVPGFSVPRSNYFASGAPDFRQKDVFLVFEIQSKQLCSVHEEYSAPSSIGDYFVSVYFTNYWNLLTFTKIIASYEREMTFASPCICIIKKKMVHIFEDFRHYTYLCSIKLHTLKI